MAQWTDGLMNRKTDGWIDKDGWLDGQRNKIKHELVSRWADGDVIS